MPDAADVIVCPTGGEEHPAWARYCHEHGCYLREQMSRPTPAERELEEAVTEEDVREGIKRFLKSVGYFVADLEQGYRPRACPHCEGRIPGGSRQTEGLPDLLAAGHGETFFVEVKSPTGRVQEAQERFHAEVRENGGRVYVWRSAAEALEHFEDHRRDDSARNIRETV